MKPITFICLLCAANLLADVASAQPPGGPPQSESLDQRVPPSAADLLLRNLQLTELQKTQVLPYLEVVRPELTAIREEAREAEATVVARLSSQIRPLLTSDQQMRLDALQVLQSTTRSQQAQN